MTISDLAGPTVFDDAWYQGILMESEESHKTERNLLGLKERLNPMKNISLIRSLAFCSVLLGAAACGSSSSSDALDGAPAKDDDVVVDVEDSLIDSESDEPTDGESPIGDQAVPLGAGPYPIGSLVITITHPEFADVEFGIDCFGDTATVIPTDAAAADQACLALGDSAVLTVLTEPADPNLSCTEQYGSAHEATIVGVLSDVSVDVKIDRVNGCGIADWNALNAILPTLA